MMIEKVWFKQNSKLQDYSRFEVLRHDSTAMRTDHADSHRAPQEESLKEGMRSAQMPIMKN